MIHDDLIEKEIRIIHNTGLYKNGEEFLKDAVNTLLASRKDLRVAIACELYRTGDISLGKACEIASVDIEEMKELLHKRGIDRKSGVEITETETMAEEAVKFGRRRYSGC